MVRVGSRCLNHPDLVPTYPTHLEESTSLGAYALGRGGSSTSNLHEPTRSTPAQREHDGECCTVTQIVQEASHSVSDSDDEQIPDPAIPPAVSNTELAMVVLHPPLRELLTSLCLIIPKT